MAPAYRSVRGSSEGATDDPGKDADCDGRDPSDPEGADPLGRAGSSVAAVVKGAAGVTAEDPCRRKARGGSATGTASHPPDATAGARLE